MLISISFDKRRKAKIKVSTLHELLNKLPEHHPLWIMLAELERLFPDSSEQRLCDCIVSLTCDNPQTPLTGAALWEKIQDIYGKNFNFDRVEESVADRLDQLASLRRLRGAAV